MDMVAVYRSWHGPHCVLGQAGDRKTFKAPVDWMLPGTEGSAAHGPTDTHR